MNSLTN